MDLKWNTKLGLVHLSTINMDLIEIIISYIIFFSRIE